MHYDLVRFKDYRPESRDLVDDRAEIERNEVSLLCLTSVLSRRVKINPPILALTAS